MGKKHRTEETLEEKKNTDDGELGMLEDGDRER